MILLWQFKTMLKKSDLMTGGKAPHVCDLVQVFMPSKRRLCRWRRFKKNYKRICISEVQINVQVSLNASSQLLTEVFYLPFPYTVLFLTRQPIMKHL